MKPLLSATVVTNENDEDFNLDKIHFPKWVSPKLDGIRCLLYCGAPMSRKLKPIRNKFVQKELGGFKYEGLDGELLVGDPCHPMCYRRSNSGVMSADGEPDFTFYVFDWHNQPSLPFHARYAMLLAQRFDNPRIKVLEHVQVHNVKELLDYEEKCLKAGYEGVMIRCPNGEYKFGRSTFKQQILMKMKRYSQEEAVIVDILEAMRNDNEAKVNALGHTERSKHQENMTPKGMVGKFVVKSDKYETTFEVGPGNLTHNELKEIWENKDNYIGKTLTYKFFAYGGYDVPRSAGFKGMRDLEDMGE